jgi:hypothetical protein
LAQSATKSAESEWIRRLKTFLGSVEHAETGEHRSDTPHMSVTFGG